MRDPLRRLRKARKSQPHVVADPTGHPVLQQDDPTRVESHDPFFGESPGELDKQEGTALGTSRVTEQGVVRFSAEDVRDEIGHGVASQRAERHLVGTRTT